MSPEERGTAEAMLAVATVDSDIHEAMISV